MRSFSKKLAFVLAAAMVVTAFAPAAKAEAAKEMAINKQGKILYVTDGTGINDAAQVGGGKGNVSSYDFAVSNKPANWKNDYTFAWSSSNEDVITVKNGGLTTAVGVGKADVVCVVTEKATGKATTLKNTVTVKANAAEVVITNADDYANTAVEVGTVVNLDRAMYDANGKKAPKRGQVVTDYTRWMAEPSVGVEIDSAKGTFKFTEEAVAGEYKLWAETYQSKKYQDATATSDVVKVELVKDMTFDVKQDTTTQFTVFFNNAVDALAVADVSVIRMLGNYEYPQVVKSVKLAEDKMSATVTVFTAFLDNTNYTIKVKGYEDYTMTASVGKPVRMELVAKDKNPSFLINTNVATEIQCVFYDAKDVIVPVSETVSLRLEKLSTTGDYYLAGKKLTIKKNTASAVIVAEYPGWFENGKRVGAFSHSQEFFAEDAAPIMPVAVTEYTVSKFEWGAPKSMQVKDTDKKLILKLQRTDWQGGDDVYTHGTAYAPIQNASITLTALNPEICVVGTNAAVNGGQLTAFKPGVASFYVNLKTYNNATKKYEENPFAVVSVTVDANSYLSYTKAENEAITVGTATGFNTSKIEIIGYDQYNQPIGIDKGQLTKVECLSEGYGDKAKLAAALLGAERANVGEGLAVDYQSWSAKTVELAVKAVDIVNAMDADKMPKAGEAATLYFKATYNNYGYGEKTSEFAITIQVPSGKAEDNYVQIMPSDTYKDVVIKNEDNFRDAKSVSFEVFYMNNGVKVQKFAFSKYPAAGADAATKDAYYFKVLKDGVDFNAVSKSGNKVTVYPTTTVGLSARAQKAVTTGAVQVSYNNCGAGTYTFALYKCYVEGDVNVLVQEYASDVVIAVGDAGSYYVAGDQKANSVEGITDATGDVYNKADAAKILKCFTIKDRKGNDVVNPWTLAIGDYTYFVDYTAAADSGFVYVKEITFYEPVDGGYVAYVVPIDVALERK